MPTTSSIIPTLSQETVKGLYYIDLEEMTD